MRNGVPDGESVVEFPSGVEEAGGVERRSLIEHLRARIHVLERVPVSLALPPATDAGALNPACSLSFPALAAFLPSPLQGEGPPLSMLAKAALHEIKPDSYRDVPAALSFTLAVLGQSLAKPAHRPARGSLVDGLLVHGSQPIEV